jgi:hypothetical protein
LHKFSHTLGIFVIWHYTFVNALNDQRVVAESLTINEKAGHREFHTQKQASYAQAFDGQRTLVCVMARLSAGVLDFIVTNSERTFKGKPLWRVFL